jgi:hypothetical protein
VWNSVATHAAFDAAELSSIETQEYATIVFNDEMRELFKIDQRKSEQC